MAEQDWEAHPRKRRRPSALLVLAALAAVMGVALLARPGTDIPPEDLVLPPASERPIASTPTPDPEADPDDGAEVFLAPEDGAVIEARAFDPSRRWRPMAPPPFDGAIRGPAVWDGTGLIAWPGRASGGVYDPEQDVWSAMPAAPIERLQGWSATWTGEEMIVWGGDVADDERRTTASPADGAAFDPRTFRWRTIAPAPIAGRTGHAAVWTGSGLVVWGGRDADGNLLDDGAIYRPRADAWEPLPPAPLSARVGAHAAWVGDRDTVLIWGGLDGGEAERDGASLVDGAVYRPSEGWRAMTPAPVPFREGASAVYTGPDRCPAVGACGTLLVWGRAAAGLHEKDGYAYDLHSDTWTELPNLLNQTRYNARGVWTGTHAIVWGGIEWRGRERRQDGYAYDPVTQRWVQIPARPGDPGADPSVIFTGTELIVWSGSDEGYRYPLAARLSED